MNKTNRNLIIATIVMIVLIVTTILGGYAAGIISPNKNSDTTEKTGLFGLTAKASDGSTETTSAEEMNEEMAQQFFKQIEDSPNLNSELTNAIRNELGAKLGYKKVGNMYVVPLSFESMNYDLNNPKADGTYENMDAQRANWSVLAGLVAEGYGFSDAAAKPFNLTEEQKLKVLALGINQYADFNDQEKEEFKLQLTRALMENPILFQGFMDLLAEQEVGTYGKIGDHWGLYQQWQAAMANGGTNSFCYKTKDDNKYYTGSNNYHQFVFGLIGFLDSMNCQVGRFEAQPGNHMMLNTWEFGADRKMTPANYEENLPSLMFIFRLKNGKIALLFGANVTDKRPEVLNYMVMPKETAVATTPSKSSRGGSSSGGGSSTPSNPTPTPYIPPYVPPTPPTQEYKHPSDDAANAITDWNDDDSGPGEHRADIGNSQSPTVEGSQAHANTVVNHDGANPSNYNPGPAADAADNGAVPDTSAPENQVGIGDGVNHDSVNGGQSTTSTTNSGRISAPPA